MLEGFILHFSFIRGCPKSLIHEGRFANRPYNRT